MTWMDVLRMIVWTGAGAVLLFVLMGIDALFTRYKDFEEMKKGNMAVTVRFVLKLFAQGYILSQSIRVNDDLWTGLLVSVVSFVILFVLELIVRLLLGAITGLQLDKGTKEGKVAYGLIAGTLHIVGALILAAYIAA